MGNKVFLPPLHNNVFDTLTIIGNPGKNFVIRTFLPDINSDSYDEIVGFWLIGREENVIIIFGGDSVCINNAITIEDPDNKTGFGFHISSFSNLISKDITSLIIGDTETVFYYDHGTGKVFIYNNDIINDIGNNEEIKVSNNFNLSQNYPNPFNPSTLIKYSLEKEELVSIEIYNILGERVDELVNEVKSEGIHQIVFNSSNLPSGVYFYSIRTQNFTDTRKMILLR